MCHRDSDLSAGLTPVRKGNGSAQSPQASGFCRYDELMADNKRQKSSADLIKEARETFTPPPAPELEQPAMPPIVRPSDRIAPSYTPPSDAQSEPESPQTARRPSEPTRTAPSDRMSTRLPSIPPSTRMATPTAPRSEFKDTTASVLNGIGWLFVVVALGLAILLVIGAFTEQDQASDLIIGGAIIVLFPLALGIALVAMGRKRKRVAAAQANAARANSAQMNAPAPAASPSKPMKSAPAGLRDGEVVIASIPGVPNGATSGSTIGVIVAAAIAFIIFSSLTGFGGFFIVAGIIFLVARTITKATGNAGSLGKAFPGSARLTITDQRVLSTVRSWAPNTPEVHMDRPISAIETFDARTGNKPLVRITFTDGEEIRMSTSVANSQAAKQALQAVTA